MSHEQITVDSVINAPIEKVWAYYTEPEHITQWAFAADDWCAPRAENDLRAGGTFLTRMEARDGSAGFDFTGTYDEVVEHEKIAYTMDDGRKAIITFKPEGDATRVTVVFDMEHENPAEVQRGGWQGILNNFKSHVEQ